MYLGPPCGFWGRPVLILSSHRRFLGIFGGGLGPPSGVGGVDPGSPHQSPRMTSLDLLDDITELPVGPHCVPGVPPTLPPSPSPGNALAAMTSRPRRLSRLRRHHPDDVIAVSGRERRLDHAPFPAAGAVPPHSRWRRCRGNRGGGAAATPKMAAPVGGGAWARPPGRRRRDWERLG